MSNVGVWKDFDKEKPNSKNLYLVERVSDPGGDIFISLDYFEDQGVFERKYSKEFDQMVNVKTTKINVSFHEKGSLVLRWMKIPT